MRNDPRAITTGVCGCGHVIMQADDYGHTVRVEALPLADQLREWTVVASGRRTYSVVAGHLKLRTRILRESPKQHLAYAEHPATDACTTRITRAHAGKDPMSDGLFDMPPFKPALCLVCRTFFTDEDELQGYRVSNSQWWAAHVDCPRKPRKI